MSRHLLTRVLLAATTFALGFAVSLASPDSQTRSDTPPAKPGYVVKYAGQMRNVMMKGDLSAHFDLASLRGTKGLYAVGPVEGLKGEITVLDGKPSITSLRDGKPTVGEAWPKACFLVYATVEAWQKMPIPKEIDSLEKLEEFVLGAAKKVNLDLTKPFPFLVTGTPKLLKYHVIWKTDSLPHTKALHEQAKHIFEMKDQEVQMIGFYSDSHHGIFTHHDSNVHVHARSTDGKAAGHVEALTLGENMQLHLPAAGKDAPPLKAPPQRKGMGMGKGMGMDANFAADRDLFHFLLTNRADIKRTVKETKGGVETVTESDKPEIAKKIQEHVASMHARVKAGNGIHYRDPLFAEVFRHYDKITMKVETTKKGVKVTESSDDPYVAKLIQSHAAVVSKFITNGHAEVMKNHALPAKPKGEPP